MSNRDCNGDFYEVNNSRWYRCLWDGTVIPAADCDGGICRHCERSIEATEQGKTKFRQFIVTEVHYGGRWNGHSKESINP